MAVVRLANVLIQGLEVDVVEPAAMKRTGRDRGGVPAPDEVGQKVVGLLTVNEPRKGAVLPLEKYTREDEDVHQEAGLALGKPKLTHRLDTCESDAVAQCGRDGLQHQRKSSATPGSNERPPPRPLPPPRP